MARAYATAALCLALLTLLLSAGVTTSEDPPAPSPSPDADGPADDDQPPLNFTSNPASLPEFPGPSQAMPPSPSVSPSPAPSYGAGADAPPATPPAADHFGGSLLWRRQGRERRDERRSEGGSGDWSDCVRRAGGVGYGSAATKYML